MLKPCSKGNALVINPPFRRPVFRDHYCASEAKSAYLWHPLDLLIQAACLKHAGYQVHALDAIATSQSLDDIRHQVSVLSPKVAVVLVAERTWPQDKATLEMLRQEGVPTIAASGDFLRFSTGPVSDAIPLIDWVITDFTTPHLAECIDTSTPVGSGVATMEDIIAKRFRDMGRTTLSYPCPNPGLFQSPTYRMPYPGFTRFASVLTGYGCPYHCLYCHVGELNYRLRSVADIMEELTVCRQQGFRQIYFRDATINAKGGHVLTWTREMKARGLIFPWAGFATAQPMTDELASAMADSGCRHLQIGLETLSDSLRDHNGKPFDGPAHHEFIRTCHRHGIEVTAHLVLGLPGETEETLDETMAGLRGAEFDYLAVNLAENRAGLPWQKQGVQLVIDPTKISTSEEVSLDISRLKNRQSQAYRQFYLRPRRLFREAYQRFIHLDVGDLKPLSKDVFRWLASNSTR